MKNKIRNNKISTPKKCPSCNGKTFKIEGEVVLRCNNIFTCSAQKIGQLVHFVSKKSLNIDGFGEKQITQFYKLKFIKKIDDIFDIYKHRENIILLDGWGELSFNKLVESIEKSKFINLDKNEQIAFAYKNKHPFYKRYIKVSTVEQERIRSLIHISTDYTPNQYWFNLFFLSVMSFTTFWFIGLMIEACIVIMRRNSEARIKNYKKEKEQFLASTKNEPGEE